MRIFGPLCARTFDAAPVIASATPTAAAPITLRRVALTRIASASTTLRVRTRESGLLITISLIGGRLNRRFLKRRADAKKSWRECAASVLVYLLAYKQFGCQRNSLNQLRKIKGLADAGSVLSRA